MQVNRAAATESRFDWEDQDPTIAWQYDCAAARNSQRGVPPVPKEWVVHSGNPKHGSLQIVRGRGWQA